MLDLCIRIFIFRLLYSFKFHIKKVEGHVAGLIFIRGGNSCFSHG